MDIKQTFIISKPNPCHIVKTLYLLKTHENCIYGGIEEEN